MSWIKTIWAEFIGLFVDDGSLAIAVLVWLGVCWLLLQYLKLPPVVSPIILFTGLAVVLAESAWRRAGKRP